MPGKKMTPAPIDRPLSRAYLRGFTGWSTAYPPGISDPTSLRLMENTMIQRDGSLRIRPGLRSLIAMPDEADFTEFIGTQEPFILNNGNIAYLLAVRETSGAVGFRVYGDTGAGASLHGLTDAGIDFVVLQGEDALNFTEATTYVKYLQIDNKILALSNAGEPMRYFTVGTTKSAKRLNSIQRPAWNPSDKLTVVEPTQAWINSGVPTSTRTNLLTNPSFETNLNGWLIDTATERVRSSSFAMVGGSWSMRLNSRPVKVNYMPTPLGTPASTSSGWGAGSGIGDVAGATFAINGTSHRLRATFLANSITGGSRRYFNAPLSVGIPRQPSAEPTPLLYHACFEIATDGSFFDSVGCMIRFYDSNGTQIGTDLDTSLSSVVGNRYDFYIGTIPSTAASARIYPWFKGTATTNSSVAWCEIGNVLITDDGHQGTYFDGDSGTDYHWVGSTDTSQSQYHPDANIYAYTSTGVIGAAPISAGLDYTAQANVRAGSVPANCHLELEWIDSSFTVLSSSVGSTVADVNSSWTLISAIGTAPAGAVYVGIKLIATSVGFNEVHYVDDVMLEQDNSVNPYFDGSFTDTSTEQYSWGSTAHESYSVETVYAAPATLPSANTPAADTLISSDATKNVYNFGFFYTFANEVGESAASQVTVIKAQRGWSQWKYELAGTGGAPNGTATADPLLCADQLVAYMPTSVFTDALDQGATKWHLYMMTWSDQDPVPVSAVRLSTRNLVPAADPMAYGYLRMTPQQADANAEIAALPSEVSRFNYSTPSSASQGVVAADRIVLVYDPVAPGVIRWSSATMGSYCDFTAARGGGYKTLSSGNLFVPASVVLWQNPQSVDTLTIMCVGIDGKSTGYYMAPAQIASQSEAVNVMGFEETTATPGTTSPYGCEVLNNALYHPLDDQLMKSTATNYNINHSSLTDPIQNVWRDLVSKDHIVSAVVDNRIYYLVHNPLGEPLEPTCWGNEVWVFDAAQKAGTWSRWLVQAKTLRKLEHGGKVYMSITRPEGVYYFDEFYGQDDTNNGESISWLIETNTQGANRAHDAWAHLQQANIIVGNFQGTMRYGVRGLDIHGKMLTFEKVVRDKNPPSTDGTFYDLQDYLLVRRDLMEWYFFAGSVTEDDAVLPSYGQLNLVQYRYTPSTVNTGYEYGSIETFEYGRAGNAAADRNTDNGVPMPFIDTGRP